MRKLPGEEENGGVEATWGRRGLGLGSNTRLDEWKLHGWLVHLFHKTQASQVFCPLTRLGFTATAYKVGLV